MPCSCSPCTHGVKGGAAQRVAICNVAPVACSGTIPGLGEVVGSVDAPPTTVASPSAQDITDFEALTWTGGEHTTFSDAVTDYPTGVNNILADDGTTWDVGDAAATEEGICRIDFTNPFVVCDTAEITLVSFLLDYTAINAFGPGTGVYPTGIWVAWRKADNSLVQLVDLGSTAELDERTRVYIDAADLITVDDIANGYGLIGINLVNAPVDRKSTQEINYISAQFAYDATSCQSLVESETNALPVVLCNPSETVAQDTAYVLSSGNVTIAATTEDSISGIPVDTRLLSIYNPTDSELIARFASSDGALHTQRVPPLSSYAFGVGNDKNVFDSNTVTFENTSAASADFIWNSSTTVT